MAVSSEFTFTTLIEFVMVFVLQRAQNKYDVEIHNRLDQIIARLDEYQARKVQSIVDIKNNKEVVDANT